MFSGQTNYNFITNKKKVQDNKGWLRSEKQKTHKTISIKSKFKKKKHRKRNKIEISYNLNIFLKTKKKATICVLLHVSGVTI